MYHSLTTAEKVVATVLAYYQQADLLEPTVSELLAWLRTYPPELEADLLLLPRGTLLQLPACIRYLLETHGYFMAAYMAAYLSPAELPFWVDDGDGGLL